MIGPAAWRILLLGQAPDDKEGAAGRCDLIPLPHPSGASTWHRSEPGRTLLRQALDLVAARPAWQAIGGRSSHTPTK